MADPAFTLTVHTDGQASLTVDDTVEDAALARFLRETADYVEAGRHRHDCDTCATPPSDGEHE